MPSDLSEKLAELEAMLGQAVGAPTSILGPEARNFGPAETFELFISPFPLTARGPFPQNGLFALGEERRRALDTRPLHEEYVKAHPYPQRDQFATEEDRNKAVNEWLGLESAALAPKIQAGRRHAESIGNLLLARKQEIFGGIAAESRTLLLQLRVLCLLDLGVAYCSWSRGVMAAKPETKTAETREAVVAYAKTLQDFFGRYASANATGLEKIAADLEAVHGGFSRGTARPLSQLSGVRIAYDYQLIPIPFTADFTNSESPDAYQFRNNGVRERGLTGFLQNFDRKAKIGPALTFTCGLPVVRYVLQHSSSLQFIALQGGSNSKYDVYPFSPVRFRIELPQRYAPVVRQAFDRFAKEFGDRVIPASELETS